MNRKWYFLQNDLGSVVSSNVRYWNPSAIECYLSGCNCSECSYKEFFEQSEETCKMKAYVLELVKMHGKPEIKEIDGYTIEEIGYIKAILEGASTKKEIAKIVKKGLPTVQAKIDNICMVAQTKGWRPKNLRDRLPELVQFIRGRYKKWTN